MDLLSAIFPYIMAFTLAAVLATLAVGVVSMFRGGGFNAKYSNKLMRLRVILQAVALALFAIFMMFFHQSS